MMLALAGCQTTSESRLGIIQAVQDAATKACGFVPTVNTIVKILNLSLPGLGAATEIAGAICKQVQAQAAIPPGDRAASPPPQVEGVRIEGYRVAQ